MQAFSRAWRYEQSLAEAALRQRNASVVTPERALDAVAREPRTYLGPPDRLHALCRSGYGAVFELAIVLGGPVFPVVW
ncbi:MAG: hypothetical protein KI785_05205, partial [Devosiaceae bacterium]|nr:hypothetical protein [Devosiaceae bacterium MH13]